MSEFIALALLAVGVFSKRQFQRQRDRILPRQSGPFGDASLGRRPAVRLPAETDQPAFAVCGDDVDRQ